MKITNELLLHSVINTFRKLEPKKYFSFFAFLFVAINSFCQPVISSFAPSSGPVATFVTISGSGFSSTPSGNIVFFGAVKATVSSASASSLTVQVPAGATYQPITVTANGLTGYSAKPFVVTFLGGNDFSAANLAFDPPIDSTTDLHPNDVAIADFDGDGKVDLATANNYSITGLPASVSVLRNTGSPTKISFAPRLDIATGTFTYGIAAADLNGDGKPDLISSSIADQKISIYKNTSTTGNISFASKIDYPSQESPYRIAVNDMDGDGKPDIVVANNIFSSTVSVFRNTSTNGNVSFAPKIDFASNVSPYSVTINDFDGDGKPDVAVCNDFANNVSVLRNTSTPGNISFAQAKDFAVGKTPKGITSGDIDGDGKTDIATANYSDHSFTALRNISTIGNIVFEAKKDFIANSPNPLSISMGDLNGDGKPDLIVSCASMVAVQNTSTVGNIAFANKVSFLQASNPNVVGIGDLDGDGKNDLAGTIFTGEKVLLYRNKNNEPGISFFDPTTASSGTTVTINGIGFNGTTAVSFGGVSAASFTVVSPTMIRAVVGPGESGDVSVTNAYGTHKKSGFTFVGPPVIFSFTPTVGNQQALITITGKNFTGTTTVKFGGVAASSFTVVSPTTITAIAGNGISGDVSVSNQYGTANAPGFTFIPPPTISSFTPINGSTGTAVVITGTNFNGATRVNFGGAPVHSFSVISSTTISVIVADGGSGNIEVVTPGGIATSAAMFTFPASTITSITPLIGNAGTTVTINGTNFRSNPTDNIVYFGAAKATVTSATNNRLIVVVPEGTTHQPITVTTNRYTSYSNEPFILTYPDGNAGINSGSFTWKAAFRSNEDPRGILLSDLDRDGKTDLIIQNYFGGSISVLRNTSNNEAVSFAPYQDVVSGLGTNTSVKIAVGDIDSDGKPDLVLSNAGITVSIFRNTSQAGSISFASKIELPADYFNPGITLMDFDEDGKTDVAVTSRDFVVATTKISIYKNTTSNGIISFASRVQFTAPDYAGDLAATDVDKDGKPDLVSCPISGNSIVAVWRNVSTSGIISFNSYQSFPTLTPSTYLAFGDLNDDGKPEIMASSNGGTFSVLKNISSNGIISFDTKIDFSVGGAATFISTGQLDGDGKLDVVVVNEKKISVFRNTSSSSVISFASKQDYSTQVTYNWVNGVRVGDIDGDGKPDICVTNGADNRVSIFKNGESKKTVNICAASATLVSNLNGNSYQWQVNSGNGFTNLSNNSFYSGVNSSTLQLTNIPLSYNNYEYRCLVDGNMSSVLVINITQSLTLSVEIAASANNICPGTSVTFTATSTNGGTAPSYQWKINGANVGTNSNTFSTSTLNNNDQVSVVLTSNANCITTPTANSNIITVTINQSSTPTVTTSVSANNICAGTSVTFTATPINGGTTPAYQWQVNNVNVGTNSNTFTSTALNNNDQVKVIMTSNASCATAPTATSTPITMIVNASTKVLGKASSPAQACSGTAYNVSFSSTNAPNGSSVQLWENINNGSFTSGSTQTYNGSPLSFSITNTSVGLKKYFFKITPATGNACAIVSNSDTSTTVVDQLAKPIIAATNNTITITNGDAGANYKWQIQNAGNWNDITPLASGLSYTATVSGMYRVQANKGTCIDYSDAQSITITDPNTNSGQTVLLYPNPTQGMLTLDSLKLTDNWEVLDIISLQSGQKVASFNIINQTKVTVNLTTISNGVYAAVLRRRDGSSISIEFVKM